MKKIKIITLTLLIVFITMISFCGIYVNVQNRMENSIKEYELDMDLKGSRNVRLTVNQDNKDIIKDSEGKEINTEEELTDEQLKEKGYQKESVPKNKSENLTVENYEKAKAIIEKRLKDQNVEEYEISVDSNSGDILLQIPENDNTDNLISNINTVGEFSIIDAETKEVLMNNEDIKTAKVMYGQGSSSSKGTAIYLNIEFNKEGKEKFKNISNTYIETKDEKNDNTTSAENGNNEENTADINGTVENETVEKQENEVVGNETSENVDNNEKSEEKTKKEITMKIDDQEIMTTSFDEPIENGILPLQIGNPTTEQETLQDYLRQAVTTSSVLKNGNMPIKYDIKTEDNEYIYSDITSTLIKNISLGVIIVLLVGLIVFAIRYKSNGLLASISFIGLISIYLLLLRYTNVTISIQGAIGIIITIVLNYIFINNILKKIKNNENGKKIEIVKNEIKEGYKEFFIRIVPICISVIAFCFVNWSTISSFGMVMFWGISLIALYNYLITATLLKIKAEE